MRCGPLRCGPVLYCGRNGKSFGQIDYEKCSSDWSNVNMMMRRGMSTSSGSAEQFILDNSEISRDHLTPEIALHLMSPSSSGLWDASIEESSAVLMENGISDPFWAFYWPGGQTLTRCTNKGLAGDGVLHKL